MIAKFVRRGWRLWLLWVLMFASAAIAFTVLAPSYYTATTTLVIDERMLRPTNDNGPSVPDPTYVDTQIQVLLSTEVFTRVLDRARHGDMDDLKEGGWRMALARLAVSYGLLDIDLEAAANRALIENLKRGLRVQRVGTSNAVDVSFTAHSAALAAREANAFAQEYLANGLAQKEVAKEEALDFLRMRLAELQSKAFAPEQPDQLGAAQGSGGADARARWREFQSSIESYRALYNNTLQRRYAQAFEPVSPSARVISAAEDPETRSWPNTPVVVVLAMVLGLCCGFAHAVWRFARDNLIRTSDDLMSISGMAPIACVPETTRRRTIKIQYGAGGAAMTVLSGPPLRDPMERLAVRLRARTQKREKTIVAVVSPNAGAGASTLAANLALALAGCGQKTLLLDANWRRTSSPAEPRSGAFLEKALTRLGEGDAAPDVLALRTKGRVFEAEASASLVDALGEAARAYRWIVVDLNPLSCSADLDAIASDITFVVLVVRAGRTTGPALEQASAIIPGDKKVALVLNRAPRADVQVCA